MYMLKAKRNQYWGVLNILERSQLWECNHLGIRNA